MATVLLRCPGFAVEVAAYAAAATVAVSCAPAPRMCTAEADCGSQAACVAGRCVLHAATPAIATARRVLVAPIDEGWVRRGDPAAARGQGDVATLGRGDGAIVFLRFSLALPPEAAVLESYLLLELAPGLDSSAAGLSLHTARVDGDWDSRSLSWGRQPSVVEVGSAVTSVTQGGGLVRLDVRPIVDRWRRRPGFDGGLAVVTEGTSVVGLPIALAPLDVPAGRGDPILAPEPTAATQPPSPFEPPVITKAVLGDARSEVPGPRLELYVR